MAWKIGRRCAVILVFAAVLAGCAAVPRQAFNSAASAHVKKVVVVHVENQDEYPANIVGHPGMSFGLIGGLVAAADIQVKTNKLTAAIDPKEARVQERLSARLVEQLRTAGYEAVVVVLPKNTNEPEALALAKQRASGDAVVVLDLYAGYWAAGPTTDYFPRMVAKVKTVDAKSDKVLYQDSISYGYNMPQAQTVHLASDPAYRFATIDALVADPAKARQGLYLGLDALAQQITADLRKK